MKLSLRTYLFACIGVSAAVPAIVLGIVLTQQSQSVQLARSDRETSLAADALARETAQLVEAHTNATRALSRQVEAAGTLDPSVLQGLVTAAHAGAPTLGNMWVANADAISLAVDPPRDATGKPAAGTNYHDRDYYKAVSTTNATAYSRAQLGRTTHQPNLQIAEPIRDPNGAFIAFSQGALDLSEIQAVAQRILAQSPGLTAVVLDNEGRVLAHPDADARLSMRDDSAVNLYAPAPYGAEIRNGTDDSGSAVRAAVTSVPFPGLGWTVIVSRTQAELAQDLATAEEHVLLTVGAGLLGALVLAAILSAALAGPIVRLATVCANIGRGDFRTAPPDPRPWLPREVSVLLAAVREMMGQLRVRTEELEGLVQERTVALEMARDESEQAQQRFQSLFDHNVDAIFSFDREGNFTSVNSAGQQLSGYTIQELEDLRFDEIVAPEDADTLRHNIVQAAQGTARMAELTIVQKSGGHRTLYVNTVPIVVSGQIVGVFALAKDITERKHAEQALARSEERFRGLVQNGAELISVVDADGTIRYATPSVELLLGIHVDDATGSRLFAFVHPEDEIGVRRLLETAADSPRVNFTKAFRVLHQDGTWRHVEAVCRNLADIQEIGGIVLNVRDVSERKALEDELAYRAYHDALTELPNRTMLVDRLRHALARSTRSRAMAGVLFIDLDDFKVVNDSLGHNLGDQLLVSVAQRLRACVRPGDTVARLGGDEFIVLLEDLTDISEASPVAERVLEQLQTAFHMEDRELVISASIGMALSGPDSVLPDDLLRNADVAMYAAKTRGKGHWVLYEAGMNTRPLDRLELEADLRRALERDELRLHYQPIIDLPTGKTCGVEALLRWEHPRRGLIQPADFIPLAEDTGMIVPIGRWALREAARQGRAWLQRNPARNDFAITVNVSSRQFQHPGLIEDVEAALREAKLPARNLRLEITESVAMEAGEITIQTLQALKGLGVQLAIDDFGTGYSSLAYLKRFPVDALKIDRTFVDGLGHDVQDTAIVRSVITIAKSLQLAVTGEGVETFDQLSELRELNCDEAQGFFFARPQSPEVVDRYLHEEDHQSSHQQEAA